MLKVVNVKKYYKLNGNTVKAVDGISYSFDKGIFYAVTGRSGSGKSTFLGLLGSLINVDEGEIFLSDLDVTHLNEKQRAKYRNEKIGFVFQNYCLESQFSCYENVLLATIPSKKSNKDRSQKIESVLEQVGLTDRREHKVCELSGGEKQRVAIARALINNPDILLADEPTGNLDSENGHRIVELLRSISRQGKIVIMVTHNMEDARESDIILHFKDGKIVEESKNV